MLPLIINPMSIPSETITFTGNLPPTTSTNFQPSVTLDQWLGSRFTTGSASYGYTLDSVTLQFREVTASTNLLVSLWSSDINNPGAIGNQITSFTNPGFITSSLANNTFTPTTPQTLAANTTYWLLAGILPGGSGEYRWGSTTDATDNSPFGWSIGDTSLISVNGGGTWNDISEFKAFQFSVNGQSYSPVVSDPYFSNVVLLLKGNGENNSINIIDSSSNPKSITAIGNTRISTDQSRFGGSSILTNNGIVESNSSLDFAFGSDDFTVEGWVYLLTIPSSGFPNLFQTTDGLLYINFRQSGFFAITTATAIIASSPSPVPLNQWSYFAITRSGSVFRVWLDGVSGTPVTASLTFASTATAIRFGDGFLESLNGYIDELRITKGIAREITLPIAPFPDL